MTIRIAHELKDLPRFPLGDLLELQGDLKDLTERNAGKLRKSITKHGLFVPFFVWPAQDGNNYILDGHQRKRTLVTDGHGALPVPCVLVHADTLQEAKEKLLVISSQYGHITQDGYDEFTFDMPDIGDLVHFDALSFEFGADEDEEPEQGDAEAQVDRAAELQELWQTERGQLWAIGEHRLLCGDSTVRADVERVMGGERADMMFTDPPYGVGYTGGMQFYGDGLAEKENREPLQGDLSPEIYGKFLPIVLPFVDGPCYVWYSYSVGKSVYDALSDNNCELHAVLIWHKINAGYGALNAQYKQRYEPCMYFKPKKSTLRWCGATTESTIWEIKRDGVNEFHPTQKPIDLALKALGNHEASIILDAFAGSGSTLVACQNLSRRGRAIEISPAYCAVILQRMTDAFPGIDIHLVDHVEYTPQLKEDKARQNEVEKEDVPDALFPTDNEFGIPVLRLDMQADFVDLPALKWGQNARGRKHAGTYHFYTDDYKFSALWADPTPVINSGCPSVVEVNYSIHEQTPKVLIMDSVYKKRWLSRYWQENGVKVFVDLGVPPDLLDTCCMGVPDGWRAFATRVYEADDFEDDLTRQHEKAVSIRGSDDVMFVVFGKSERIRAYCAERHWEFVKTINF